MANNDLGVLLFGIVKDAGGGRVEVVIDRDTEQYPEQGTRVAVVGADPDIVWIKKSIYDATHAAYEQAIEALDVVAQDGDTTQNTERALARIVARSARTTFEAGQP